MSSPVQPYPPSDWMGHSLATPCSSVSSAPQHLDSSFCSEFSPLPPSPPPTDTHTHTPRSLEEMLQHTQDLPLPLKLQQLKQWQQHMQEQLKAHQRDQQRLLGMELADYPDSPVLRGSGYPESPVLRGSGYPESPVLGGSGYLESPVLGGSGYPESPVMGGSGYPERGSGSAAACPLRAAPSFETDTQEPWTLEADSSSSNNTTPQGDSQPPEPTQGTPTQDRPIRPGVGRRVHTFEELLEEELKMEQERQKGKAPVLDQSVPGPKRSFLRKGEGLSRFHRTSSKPTTQNRREPLARQREPQRNEPRQTRPRPLEPSTRGHSQHTLQNTHHQHQHQHQHQDRDRDRATKPRPGSTAARTFQRKTASLASHTHTQPSHTPTLPSHTHTQPSHTHTQATHTPTLPSHTRTDTHAQPSHTHTDTHAQASHTSKRSPCGAAVAMETSFEVWQRERQREWAELGEFELLEVAAEELSITSGSSSILHTHTRRLSSTPIKAHTHSAVNTHTHSAVNTHTTDSPSNAGYTHTPHTLPRGADTGGAEREEGGEDDGPSGDEQMHDEEEEEEEEDDEITRVAPNSHCLPVTTPPYDRCTYQEPEGAGQGEESAALSDGVEVEFDDDDTWADISQDALQPQKTLRRKVATTTGVEWVSSEDDQKEARTHTLSHIHSHTHSHTSQLVAKLFPALQPKPHPSHVTQNSPQPIRKQESEGVCEVMRDRLVQLELEIERFRMETKELAHQRSNLATHTQELRRERAEFEAQRSRAEAEWAELKQAETRKLQRDRRMFQKHSASARHTHTSAQREELQVLKQQLCEVREECVRKEQRWKSTHTRLQQQIHTLTAHNQELQQQIHTLENLRLSRWRSHTHTHTSAQREESRAGGRKKTKEKGDEERPGGAHSPKSNSRSSDNSSPEGNRRNSGSPTSGVEVTHTGHVRDDVTHTGHVRDDVTHTGHVCDDVTHAELSAVPAVQLASQQEDEITHPDGKVERVFTDGSRLLVFPNGTQKLLSTDGSAKVTFFNGDIKEVCPDHRVVYFFADAQTTHTTFPDGTELLQFPNSQTEKLYPDGRKEIVFPDQTMKTLYPDGREESVLPDGTIIRLNTGVREVVFVSGEREEHAAEWRRRIYGDGTVKTVYTDGRQETHYASGRLRIKDPQGRVVMDTHTP
ncbi:centromere protein J isoform X2 [Sardina pilchardus]|uniref:centromere protein J isoform X2 n=1 Tax=Sardina pilchardus TaxID=27697 RepID=UPI002E145BE8